MTYEAIAFRLGLASGSMSWLIKRLGDSVVKRNVDGRTEVKLESVDQSEGAQS
jgi:hypothetical protein